MCGCGKTKGNGPALWTVKLASGQMLTYSSDIAAKAKHKATPGSILTPPPGVSV